MGSPTIANSNGPNPAISAVLGTVANNSNGSKIRFDGVPAKAYQWQNKTEHMRESHLRAAMEGEFDAPELIVKMEDEDLFTPIPVGKDDGASANDVMPLGQRLAHLFPSRWKAKPTNAYDGNGTETPLLPSAPDVRPFTSSEMNHLYQNDDYVVGDTSNASTDDVQQEEQENKHPFNNFASSWPGADATVPPCTQAIGTTTYGMARWNNFVQNGGLSRYGKERNDARLVHSVSRMSAFLNFGIVSIFRLVWEVKRAQKQQQKNKGSNGKAKATKSRWDNKNKSGADKFEEEIVKWREMSYAHAFARDDYDDVGSLPSWSVSCLNNFGNRGRYTIQQLASGTTGDAKWDAMQQYLVRTGELHNNVRMTWGKTVVEWIGCSSTSSTSSSAQLTLQTLCYLNDRYALDGLSPPSYAGLLWCMGWTDKPNGSSNEWTIAKKPAHRYRMNPEDFRGAEVKLLTSKSVVSGNGAGGITGIKRQRSVLDMMKMQSSSSTSTEAVAASSRSDQNEVEMAKANASESKGMKRSGSFTIDRFLTKKAKAKTEDAEKSKPKTIVG